MNYFSTFTGVGGFELGIEYANLETNQKETQHTGQEDEEAIRGRGNKSQDERRKGLEGRYESGLCKQSDECSTGQPICIGFSEIDKYANQVLKYRFPNTKNYGDIKEINWNEVPDFDLLVGGSPCQDFSVAGKRAGISGERSGLFDEYVRCLQEKRPQFFIWENVKGVLSSNKGRDFAFILDAFSQAGYSLWWQVLNAKDFGVPQNRERIFVVGTRDGSPREVLFERRSTEKDTIANTIRTGGKGSLSKKHAWDLIQRQPFRYLKRNQRNIEGDYAFCIDASQTSGVKIDTRVRRLTPKECERLMSWPDDWTRWGINDKGEKVEISDTQRYKMCGNGVVSKVVQQVFKNLVDK